MKTSFWLAGIAVVAVAAGAVFYRSTTENPATAVNPLVPDVVAMATPPGITLQSTGAGPLLAFGGGVTAYADAKGMTLYTYDKDTEPNKSACTGDCAKDWPPAAAANAQPMGHWTIVARDDGTKQWAYKGKPLYTSTKDKKSGDAAGNGADKAWHTALYQPAAGISFPDGIALQDVADAGGQALVSDRGMVLFAYDGDIKHDTQACSPGVTSCAARWVPYPAAEIANPVGDFSIVSRPDGSRQWAYKGRPLYTFAGDMVADETVGAGIDKQWHPALLQRYFTPSDLTVVHTPGHGDTLADANRMTLYRRDAKPFQTGGHALPQDLKGIPGTGRIIGTNGCNADCLTTFHPFQAPADAQPSGYWDVVAAADGGKQWTYKGYALYTYSGDKKPGDMNAFDIYDILVKDGIHKIAYPALPDALAATFPNYSIGLYWTYAQP